MRWVAKAALQQGIGALPRAESVNYAFQRRITRTLPAGEGVFRRKFAGAVARMDTYLERGPSQGVGDATFYEFGAGWDLAIPLAYWSLGLDRQVMVDIRPNLRPELVNLTIERLHRLGDELQERAGRDIRDPGQTTIDSADELEVFGIRYLAPTDARATGLDSESVDFVTSTNTLEHIPVEDLVPILRECNRLLRRDGAMSCRIDLCDHFSYADRGVSAYHFLRYSDRTWRLFDSAIGHQNRLRRPDYLRAFEKAGFFVISERSSRASERDLARLRNMPLAERYRAYRFDDLAVTRMALFARPAPIHSPDTAEELDDLVGRGSPGVGLGADSLGGGGGNHG